MPFKSAPFTLITKLQVRKSTYLFLAQKSIQHFPQDRLKASRDNVKRDLIGDAEFVEPLEIRIYLEAFLHYFESLFEGYVEGCPHLFRDFAEGAFAGFDLFIKDLAALGPAAVSVKQDMSGILHEDCTVEIWGSLVQPLKSFGCTI